MQPTCWWRVRASGVLFCWELLLGTVIFGFYLLFPSQSGCPPRFKNFPQTRQCKTPFPGRISVLSSSVSLFIFSVLSYLLSKTMGCFSGRLMTSASDQKLFCEVCSVFGYSFDEFVGEKVVSPSYSSTILAPPPVEVCLNSKFSKEGKAEWWDSIRYTHSACISSLPVCSVMSDSLQTHGL